jgi:hypothetical protein
MKDNKDTMAVDISDIEPSQGDCICPYCDVFMLPLSPHDYESIRTYVSTYLCFVRNNKKEI